MSLAKWLKQVLGAGAQASAPCALAPAEPPGTCLAADQSPCPTVAGAAYRSRTSKPASSRGSFTTCSTALNEAGRQAVASIGWVSWRARFSK